MAPNIASTALRCGLRPVFTAVPRDVALRRCRPFSPPSRRNYAVDYVVGGPLFILDAVHGLGIPWFAALPLSAMLVRGVFIYAISTLPSRRNAIIRSQVMPVTSGSDAVLARNWKVAAGGPLNFSARLRRNLRAVLELNVLTSTMSGSKTWWRTAINLGTLISFAEAIRLKCGAREGLLRMIVNSFSSDVPEQLEKKVEVVSRSPAEILADRLEEARSVEMQRQQASSDPVDVQLPLEMPLANTPDVASPYFDPSLQAEGLSWCTDLTLCDTTMILPCAMAGVLALSVVMRPRIIYRRDTVPGAGDELGPNKLPTVEWIKKRTAAQKEPGYLSTLTVFQKLGLCISLLLPIVAYRLPGALLLYLISSMATGWLQGRWLDFHKPIPKPIRPSSRLMRVDMPRFWS